MLELTDEELDELPISAVMDGKVQTFPDAAALDEALNAEPMPEPAGNFHITDDHLGEGGAKQKYARNILQRKICICAHECTACHNNASFLSAICNFQIGEKSHGKDEG